MAVFFNTRQKSKKQKKSIKITISQVKDFTDSFNIDTGSKIEDFEQFVLFSSLERQFLAGSANETTLNKPISIAGTVKAM